MEQVIRTKEEIEGLKNAWRNDPIWDLEETQGFEEHYQELLGYRKHWEQVWEDRRNKKLLAKAEKLGIPGNVTLAKYIDNLEAKVEQLADKIFNH